MNRSWLLRVVYLLQSTKNEKIANRFLLPGSSGIGELLANTLAVRNVNVIVLDVNPIITENCAYKPFFNFINLFSRNPFISDNITYYKCDVSKWEEVEAVSKRIVDEVRCFLYLQFPCGTHRIEMKVGHPTVLINNAGVVQGKLLLDLQPDDIKQCVV